MTKQKAIEIIKSECYVANLLDLNRTIFVNTALDMAIKALEEKPKGKWIHWTDDYKDYVTCSCCKYGEEGEVLLSDKTPFCPICGANMRESEGDRDGK